MQGTSTLAQKTILLALVVALTASLAGLLSTEQAADASNHPTVRTCEPGTDCDPAVFAVCFPQAGVQYPCTGPAGVGPRDVDIVLDNFSPNTDVHVWWLKTEVTDPAEFDCTQALTGSADDSSRTHLADVTMDGNGSYTIENESLPPGDHAKEWNYGSNWVCATDAPHSGGSGDTADRLFTVYPF